MQLLWVNLIMDTLAALALGTEVPTTYDEMCSMKERNEKSPLIASFFLAFFRALLARPPTGRSHPLISAVMWRNIIGQGIYQLVVLFAILYFVRSEEDSVWRNTFLFNTFVLCQVSLSPSIHTLNITLIHGARLGIQ